MINHFNFIIVIFVIVIVFVNLWLLLLLLRLHGDILRLREDCERKITQYSQETVQTDLQMEALQTTCEKLKGDITARIQDIDRFVGILVYTIIHMYCTWIVWLAPP